MQSAIKVAVGGEKNRKCRLSKSAFYSRGQATTAVSDLETLSDEVKGGLWFSF